MVEVSMSQEKYVCNEREREKEDGLEGRVMIRMWLRRECRECSMPLGTESDL